MVIFSSAGRCVAPFANAPEPMTNCRWGATHSSCPSTFKSSRTVEVVIAVTRLLHLPPTEVAKKERVAERCQLHDTPNSLWLKFRDSFLSIALSSSYQIFHSHPCGSDANSGMSPISPSLPVIPNSVVSSF